MHLKMPFLNIRLSLKSISLKCHLRELQCVDLSLYFLILSFIGPAPALNGFWMCATTMLFVTFNPKPPCARVILKKPDDSAKKKCSH